MYTELIQLRQQNRVLETRIKQLEFQNFNMTRTGFGAAAAINKPQSVHGGQGMPGAPKNAEPSRPIFERPVKESML